MGAIRSGVSLALEAMADDILHEALAPLPPSQKTDILTPWKDEDRRSREVYNGYGVAEPTRRQGTFGRAYNSQQGYLNSVNGGRGYHHREGMLDPTRSDDGQEYVSVAMQQAFGIDV